MSDLLALDRKNREGDKWRGTIDVEVDGEEFDIKHRLLYDDEIAHAIDIMGEETFKEVFANADEMDDEDREKVKRVQQLTGKNEDELTDEEQVELDELREDETIAGMSEEFFKLMDPDIVGAMQYAAKQGVKADREDGDAVLEMTLEEQQERFGDTAKGLDDARELAEKSITDRLANRSTKLVSVLVGSQVFFESLNSLGN